MCWLGQGHLQRSSAEVVALSGMHHGDWLAMPLINHCPVMRIEWSQQTHPGVGEAHRCFPLRKAAVSISPGSAI